MGNNRSKVNPLTFEEACKKVPSEVMGRLEETFKRNSSSSYLAKLTFVKDILGENVPEKLSDAIYRGFGGGEKGIGFKDLFCGLVLLVYGTKAEKAKFLSQMLSEDGELMIREKVEAIVRACDSSVPEVELDSVFKSEQRCRVEDFQQWLLQHPHMASFSTWLLLQEEPGFSLEGAKSSLNFYETLGEKFGVKDKDVMDVEKTYWALKGSGKLDLETFHQRFSSLLPEELIPAIFKLLDVNEDGHLDVSELLCAVSIWCSVDYNKIHKFCFNVFDMDRDGKLSESELTSAIRHMQAIQEENTPLDTPPGTPPLSNTISNGTVNGVMPSAGAESSGPELDQVDGDVIANLDAADEKEEEDDEEEEEDEEEEDVDELDSSGVCEDTATILAQYGRLNEDCLSEDEYISWAKANPELSYQLPHLLFEMAHVQLGVRPKSRQDEARVIGGYLLRFARSKRKPGDLVYILCANWFKLWMDYTGYQGVWSSLRSQSVEVKKSKKRRRKWKKKRKKNKHKDKVGINHVTDITVATWEGNDKVGECEVIEVTSSQVKDASQDKMEANLPPAPPPIRNNALIVEEKEISSSSKKLPSLTNEGGKLPSNKLLVEHKHFVLVTEVIWKVLVSWYCPGTYSIPALPRTVGQDGMVDLYPIFFKVYRHTTLPPPIKPSSLPWFLSSLINNLGLGAPTPTPSAPLPMAVGSGSGDATPAQPPTPRRVPYYTAAFVKTTTLAEISEKMQQMLHVKTEDLRIYSMVDENNPVLLEEEGKTIGELEFHFSQQKPGTREGGYPILVETRNKDNTWPEEMIALVHEVQDKDKDKLKKKVQKSVSVEPGATGLSNLGNTCFMNSALQCVSNAKPLTKYFQKKDHLLEINKDNPLGMQGVMAKRYGELVSELWSGNTKSITPLKFRFTVGRCAPHFTGFQQQDSQELLAFVLDGLHEDLNRVKDKAYKELSDSDGRPDEEVAKEAWDYHLSRNQSIIVDLFQGQLKSEVTCKTCQYTSVRFDPFTFLSLPLPMDSTVNLEVIVMFLDGRQPVKYGLKMEIDDRYSQLKEELSRLCGIPSGRLLLAEIASSLFRSLVEDKTKIRNALGGWLYAYELPPSQQVPATNRSESPDELDRQRRLKQVRRERTLSLKQAEEAKKSASSARENLARRGLREPGLEDEEVEIGEEVLACEGAGSGEMEVGSTGREAEVINGASHEHVHELINGMGAVRGEEIEGRKAAGGQSAEDEKLGKTVEPCQEEECCLEDASHQEQKLTDDERDLPMDCEEGVAREGASQAVGESVAALADGKVDADMDICPREDGGTPMEVEENEGDPAWDSDEATNILEVHRQLPAYESYVYAMHRRPYTIEHYFLSNQQSRPFLFSIPLIVPCTYYQSRRRLYEAVWTQFKRLIIPDPPTSGGKAAQVDAQYPFVLKQVTRDGQNCSHCPWHRFCRGCAIPCDYGQVGNAGKFISIDWDETTFHLKYVMAQEKALEHESMDSLKVTDTKPIELDSCFKAFVRKDELGEDESWYCKRCKTHREAVKSLEIWRLPPILIIHLKRFQFVNGRWIKSQRAVTFPLEGLDPLRYTLKNGKRRGTLQLGKPGVSSSHCSTSAEPMEEGPASKGETSSLPSSGGESPNVSATRGKSPSQVPAGSDDSGSVSRSDEIKTGGDSDTVDEDMENRDGGVAETEQGRVRILQRKRSAHIMGESPGEEEGLSTGTDGAEAASTSDPTAPDPALEEEVPSLYNLFAISSHTGVLGGGHYTSFAKNINENWYYFNDSSCKETSPERVEQESPYMLFYELQSIGSMSGRFRAPDRQGKSHQDIGTTEDDKEFEETLKSIKKNCSIQ